MKVYTKTGDNGLTGLLSGERVPKDNLRVEAYGALDEANSVLGLAKALTQADAIKECVEMIQTQLFMVCADLATCVKQEEKYQTSSENVKTLEAKIDEMQKLVQIMGFAIPGQCAAGAALDMARTIVRRAERWVVKLSREEIIETTVLIYLNRLSDLLFVLARYQEQENFVDTIKTKVLIEVNKVSVLDKAEQIIRAAKNKAQEIGIPMVIAVVDAGGNLVALARMDEALLVSLKLAQDKAYTALALKIPTHELSKLVQPGASLYGINTVNNGKIVTFGGGFPLLNEGQVVGGIGVSGGTVAEDILVARAAVDVWHTI